MINLVKISYCDGANYEFVNTIEVSADLLTDKKVGDEVEITELGISLSEWKSPKYRDGFIWDEDDHTFVTIESIA
jgi:hypothetical protein